AVSVVAALLISNFITQPLRLIQNMLSRVELGKVNKPIEYDGQDEIGRLVAVYNKKVTELEQSAELLARSERESAWREMAKQVAHEIKNPLTPMKLSVQHLLRSYKDNPENWGDRLSRFSTTIIEQIDTLSVIASEFSNFAKMPKAVNERLNLREVLSNSVDLFRDQPGLVVHDQSIREGGAVPVYADKDQLTRVFNNLLKNAKQAIPEGRKGKLEVYLRQRNDLATVEIKDNGTGIPPERIDRIFQPNFTTKTSGMGLGLSMVKNMVEEAGGRVWFQTEIDQGTSFFVTLPLHPDAAQSSEENS
ncbi:MAG: ATP-binding protein, partial [Bacteroidota bacterium]